MKKILFVITKSNFGGAQRYVYDLATNLPKEDFEIVVALGGEGILKTKLLEKNIRIIELQNMQRDINLKNEWKSFIELFKIIKAERPDIIHGNSSKAGGTTAFIARLLRVPKIIFTAHAWAFNENRSYLSKSLITFLHWLNVFLSHRTIAVSKNVKHQVSNFPFIREKIKVIHLGINPPNFLSKTDARVELNINQNGIILGTIAELHPIKGLRYAIDSLSYIRDKNIELFNQIFYFIIGEGESREFLEKHISKRRLQDKVFLLGWKNDAAKYLPAFDLFILPSLSEAFGYVLLEAGQASLPVIASDVGGIPEIVEDAISGKLFLPKDSKAIQLAIESTINNREKIEKWKQALNEKVVSQFSLEKMLGSTMDIYNENV